LDLHTLPFLTFGYSHIILAALGPPYLKVKTGRYKVN
jgi:hypothetical protein